MMQGRHRNAQKRASQNQTMKKSIAPMLVVAGTLFLAGCATPQRLTQSGPGQTQEPDNASTSTHHIMQWEFKTAIDSDASEASLCHWESKAGMWLVSIRTQAQMAAAILFVF